MAKSSWELVLNKTFLKVIDAFAEGRLKSSLPVRGRDDLHRYEKSTYLECIGRMLCGLSSSIELAGSFSKANAPKFFQGLVNVTDNRHADFLNFNEGTQPLVDAAFLALAFLRSPNILWKQLPDNTKHQVLISLKSTRVIKPHFNNWLLFSAMIEAFFFMVGEDYDKMRIDYALRQHEQWYLGDGHYGDGSLFRADYYNSYVILPFLLQITETLKGQVKDWDNIGVRVLQRAQRYAEIQERMISPDGTFPPIGRSLAYRGAAFHLLAQLALIKKLPQSLKPAQVRCALWSVIEKTLLAPENYDENGWLTIGLNSHQPDIGENYISTGSLYLTSVIFLPLGLPEDDEFWRAPDEPWTQRKVWWFGDNLPADKAL
ncbi:DUF2264 domain-containing protein [Arsukibacterium sp.]|uniref:DUF2264 domain-containing protein n=1 Tax=Arsukibacterium sp. TaxID=1977258 RepID=UPI001BD5445D|nr:DUF2264 domain-containing protein [Arsukibacterium sp.]